METTTARSQAESVKEGSRHLRGSILQELSVEGPFSKETVQILKFHGMYQQQDRDAKKRGEAVHGSMVRVGIPGGVLSAEQYLALDRLADEAGDGTLRVTSRQDVQYHRVQKQDLHALVGTLNRNLLTTLAACGDVVRNVTCCPAPAGDARAEHLQRFARSLSAGLKPATTAYYEIWLDGEKAAAAVPAGETEEPLYGPTYLPRKFKIGLTPPGDNCIDVYSNDVGLVPFYGESGLEDFTVLAGGGLGMSPGAKYTHPRLATPVFSVAPDRLEEMVRAIITIHRDYGNRANRKLARLKYLLDEWGVERFQTEVESRLGRKLAPPRQLEWRSGHDHFGWHEEEGGRFYLGIPVLSGRVADTPALSLRTALREIAERFRTGIRFTPQQNILLTGIGPEDRAAIGEALARHGVVLAEALPPVLRHSMSCPALPTCGQAVTEAERVQPGLLDDILLELATAGLDDAVISVRTTGCANGCARPYTAEIGIVGQSVTLHLEDEVDVSRGDLIAAVRQRVELVAADLGRRRSAHDQPGRLQAKQRAVDLGRRQVQAVAVKDQQLAQQGRSVQAAAAGEHA